MGPELAFIGIILIALLLFVAAGFESQVDMNQVIEERKARIVPAAGNLPGESLPDLPSKSQPASGDQMPVFRKPAQHRPLEMGVAVGLQPSTTNTRSAPSTSGFDGTSGAIDFEVPIMAVEFDLSDRSSSAAAHDGFDVETTISMAFEHEFPPVRSPRVTEEEIDDARADFYALPEEREDLPIEALTEVFAGLSGQHTDSAERAPKAEAQQGRECKRKRRRKSRRRSSEGQLPLIAEEADQIPELS